MLAVVVLTSLGGLFKGGGGKGVFNTIYHWSIMEFPIGQVFEPREGKGRGRERKEREGKGKGREGKGRKGNPSFLHLIKQQKRH